MPKDPEESTSIQQDANGRDFEHSSKDQRVPNTTVHDLIIQRSLVQIQPPDLNQRPAEKCFMELCPACLVASGFCGVLGRKHGTAGENVTVTKHGSNPVGATPVILWWFSPRNFIRLGVGK
jgi:hypothetical protein